MHPLDALAQLFNPSQAQQPGAAAPQQSAPSAMWDWFTRLHNSMAPYTGGLLSPMAQYSNDPAQGPAGFNINDIAKMAAADAAKKAQPAK